MYLIVSLLLVFTAMFVGHMLFDLYVMLVP